jgi:N-dimethylarginine dimethylaminohydrolase
VKKQTFQSEIGVLQNVILKHPRDAFISQRIIDNQWERLNYTKRIHFLQAIKEYDQWAQLFTNADIKIHWVGEDSNVSLDSIYVRDASVLTDRGAIICSMGKIERRGEDRGLRTVYNDFGIPILGIIDSPGKLEAGDTLWLSPELLAVGLSYRTNEQGIRQLKNLSGNNFEIIEVDLPHFRGPDDVFHLMSIISPIDQDLLLAYSPLMPVRFRLFLLARGFTLVDVPEEEFNTMATNVLALGPRKCIMLEGNPVTKSHLEYHGVEIITYSGQEISVKGMGGPTCLTRPLWRTI